MKHHWGWTILVLLIGIAIGYWQPAVGRTLRLNKLYMPKS